MKNIKYDKSCSRDEIQSLAIRNRKNVQYVADVLLVISTSHILMIALQYSVA